MKCLVWQFFLEKERLAVSFCVLACVSYCFACARVDLLLVGKGVGVWRVSVCLCVCVILFIFCGL